MGCCSGNSTIENEDDKKQFHNLSEEEKNKIKKEIEEQDKNLESKEVERPSAENYDWIGLLAKLPVKKTKEEREQRLKLWKKLNEYGNGYLSYKRLSFQIEKYLELPGVLADKGPVKLAFDAASDKYVRYGLKKEDNLIEWMEFRIFLVYLKQYFEYYIMFNELDKSQDNKISVEEFKKAIPKMKNWGVEINESNAEKEFNLIDSNGSGTINFEEFCNYAIKKSLDKEEDIGFDNTELKNLKK